MVGNYARIDMDWLDFRERIEVLRYFRVFEGESSFTALFNDIFSYISKTTEPILMRFSVTCLDGPGKYTEQHKIEIDWVVFEI